MLQNPKYRDHGSSNGSFGELQFFTCEENAGMFVSLDRLSPIDLEQYQQTTQPPTDGRQHQMKTRAQVQQDNQQQKHRNRSPVRSQPQFKIDDRVVAYNRKGQGIHGSVRWTGNINYANECIPAIGIETVNVIDTMLEYRTMTVNN